jgi:uncharacterized protein YjiS (DUF1127 family)
MCNILYVSSSPRGSASYSNRVAARVIDELRQANPQSTLTVRELAQEPLPHIDADFVAATRNAGGPSTDKQRAVLTKSDALVDELLAADIVVIAAPMINFSVSTTLKSWFDYVARGRQGTRASRRPRARFRRCAGRCLTAQRGTKAISAFPRASPVLPPARVTRQLGQHQCKTDGCCAEATQTN